MPGTIEDITKLLSGISDKTETCYLIIRPDEAEVCYDRRGLLSRLKKTHSEYFPLYVYKVNLSESPPQQLLKNSEMRKLRRSLEKVENLKREFSELEEYIELPE